jgi:predicted amidohydrolase
MEHIRYSAAACQTDQPNPADRREMRRNTDRILSMIDSAVARSAPFLPVKLVVFPEFAHAAPVFPTAEELIEKLAVEIPNEHTERIWQKAKEHNIYIQTGSMLEIDKKYKNALFNTTCLIGPKAFCINIARSTLGFRMKFTPARTTSKVMTSRCFQLLTRQSVKLGRQFVTIGCFPKCCGNSRRTARKF